jgi:hypothetical protein
MQHMFAHKSAIYPVFPAPHPMTLRTTLPKEATACFGPVASKYNERWRGQ